METKKELLLTATAYTTDRLYQTTVSSGNHVLIADEPHEKGGKDTGMDPFALLLASLGSCTSITLRMYIDHKKWKVADITVSLEMFRTDDGILIERQLNFTGDISQEQLHRLVEIADHCPIHKIFIGNIAIVTTLAK